MRHDDPNRHTRIIGSRLSITLAALLPAIAVAQTPLVTFAPLTPTSVSLPANGVASVMYTVTNQAAATRSFAMSPIQGVHQVTAGSGRCAGVFVLANSQSCVLDLSIVGSEIGPGGIHGGPVVCVSNNPLQCFQPSATHVLDISLGPPSTIVLTADSGNLTFTVGSMGMLGLTHTGNVAANAEDITVDVPVGTDITADVSDCQSLSPFAHCTLRFSATAAQPTSTLIIAGSNTDVVEVDVTVIDDRLFADGFDMQLDQP